jgi:uncharacterized protein
MFRNVYWHHAVRAATVLYKRVVSDALQAGIVAGEELVGATDEGLLHLLTERAAGGGSSAAVRVAGGIAALRTRRLPKRAAEVSAAELEDARGADWLQTDSPLKRRVEDSLAGELGGEPGTVYLDFPEKPAMFGLDLLLRRRSGAVLRLGPSGYAGLIGLPRIADELYRSARMLRLYVAGPRIDVPAVALQSLADLSADEVTERLDAGTPLLGGAGA